MINRFVKKYNRKEGEKCQEEKEEVRVAERDKAKEKEPEVEE
jgi:hypothetical protein